MLQPAVEMFIMAGDEEDAYIKHTYLFILLSHIFFPNTSVLMFDPRISTLSVLRMTEERKICFAAAIDREHTHIHAHGEAPNAKRVDLQPA